MLLEHRADLLERRRRFRTESVAVGVEIDPLRRDAPLGAQRVIQLPAARGDAEVAEQRRLVGPSVGEEEDLVAALHVGVRHVQDALVVQVELHVAAVDEHARVAHALAVVVTVAALRVDVRREVLHGRRAEAGEGQPLLLVVSEVDPDLAGGDRIIELHGEPVRQRLGEDHVELGLLRRAQPARPLPFDDLQRAALELHASREVADVVAHEVVGVAHAFAGDEVEIRPRALPRAHLRRAGARARLAARHLHRLPRGLRVGDALLVRDPALYTVQLLVDLAVGGLLDPLLRLLLDLLAQPADLCVGRAGREQQEHDERQGTRDNATRTGCHGCHLL